jgi:hypothetical protein
MRIVAAQLATGLVLAELDRPRAGGGRKSAARSGPPVCLRFHCHDGSVFVDNDYVIKGVSGRLLHRFVSIAAETGRRDFSNREIRLDASLQLPEFKDNLETRLILLRRRLEEKAGPIRLTRPARGRVRIEIDGEPRIEVVEAAPPVRR